MLIMNAVKYFFIAVCKFAGIFVKLRAVDVGRRHAVKCPIHNDMIPAFTAGDILFFNRHRVNSGFWNLDFGMSPFNKLKNSHDIALF